MNALSLSHLTYCDRTTTVRSFHSLDHPPFPCTFNLSPCPIRVKRTRPDYVKDEHRRSPCGIAAVHPMAALSLACTRTQSIFFLRLHDASLPAPVCTLQPRSQPHH